MVVENIAGEGASDRGACPPSEEDLDSMAFAGGEGDKIQRVDRETAPQIRSCSRSPVVLRGPCAAVCEGEGGREGTWPGDGSQAYYVVVAAPCSHWASCDETCDYCSLHNQEQNGNEALLLCWGNGNEILHLY